MRPTTLCNRRASRLFEILVKRPLLFLLFSQLLPYSVFGLKVSVVSSTEEAAPVPDALVTLNQKSLFTDSQGMATFAVDADEDVELTISHPDYLFYQKTIRSSENHKEVVTVRIEPEVTLTWIGSIVDQYAKQPVVGATVVIEAVNPRNCTPGTHQTVSDTEGAFQILKVATGNYRLSIAADNFDLLEQDIRIDAGAEPKTWELNASIEKTASIDFEIFNSETGKAVDAATVTLSEGLNNAVVAVATSNASGKISLSGLKVGRENRMVEGKSALTLAHLVALVEAEGYYKTALAVTVEGSYSVNMDPINKVSENEPNDSFETANPVRPNIDILHKIESVGQKDYFKFELPVDSFIEVQGSGSIERHYQLLDNKGNILHQQGVPPNKTYHHQHDLARGAYFIKVEEWWQQFLQ